MLARWFTPLAFIALLGAGCTAATTVAPEPAEETNTAATDTTESSSDTTMATYAFPGTLPAEEITGKQVRITTQKGEIVIALYPDTAPNTVSNFVYLINSGYYNGLTFHRREPGFVIQGGDPNGNGTGGPGYKFADELADSRTYTRGIVAMANSGPNTNGSQFFVMLADVALPHLYTIFGEVTSGLDVVDKIAVGDVMTAVVVEAAP